nr:MmgE/PrpD family protein [Mesorhizobium sp. WSM4875]
MGQWITKELAEYAVSTSIETYPVTAIEQAKLFILDTIGCMVGGTETALGKTMATTLQKAGGGGNSTIVGTDLKLSVADAALLNGTTANALDFEETLAGIGHPSGTVIGAALAVGEDRGISGAEFLDAVLVGYDIGNRIGRAIQPTYERLQKVWFVGTWQTFSAVSAASKCLKLDLARTLNAYGTAGATAPLPNTQKWGWELDERPIHWAKEPTGWPSWTGTIAALLAEDGFVGNRFILDGDKGFWAMAGSDRVDYSLMRRNLGTEFEVMNLSFKPYSCCRWQHAALDCIAELIGRLDLHADDVSAVDIYTFDWVQNFEVYGPVDLVDACFSMPHSVTMMLHRITPGPKWFVPEVLRSEKLIEYSRRVKVKFDDHYNRRYHEHSKIGARVELTLKSGETVSTSADTPTGTPEKPMSQQAIEDKFLSMVAPVLGDRAASDCLLRITELEESRNIGDILQLTRKPKYAQAVRLNAN